MTSQDVTSVELSRLLKRNGAPQHTQAYWYGSVPSLSTIAPMAAIATEKRKQVQWLLVLNRPPEPSASAFTLEELKQFLKAFLGSLQDNFPTTQEENKKFICSTDGKKFLSPKEVDAFAQAALFLMHHE